MRTVLLILALVLPAMAGREFVAASSQYGTNTVASVSTPITLATWAWIRQSSAVATVLSINAADNGNERLNIYFNGAEPTDLWGITSGNSAGTTAAAQEFPASGVTNRWQHVAGVFASATSRVLYVDGVSRATNTTSITTDNLTVAAVGARQSSSVYSSFWLGGLAEAAVWSAALTASEIASLASGAAPFMVRPASLVFYAPLTGRETATEWNYVGAPVNLLNSPTAGDSHPRIYRP